jgi:hypothetical protein
MDKGSKLEDSGISCFTVRSSPSPVLTANVSSASNLELPNYVSLAVLSLRHTSARRRDGRSADRGVGGKIARQGCVITRNLGKLAIPTPVWHPKPTPLSLLSTATMTPQACRNLRPWSPVYILEAFEPLNVPSSVQSPVIPRCRRLHFHQVHPRLTHHQHDATNDRGRGAYEASLHWPHHRRSPFQTPSFI